MANRITSFDGLRGIAVLGVVLFHCFVLVPALRLHYPGQLIFTPLFRYGWLGVYLFFIISGFVISFTLYKYANVKNFAIARFAKLYPTYWAAVIFAAVLTLLARVHFDFPLYLINLLMFQGLLHFSDVSGVFWTLSYELVFYVIAGTIFYVGDFSKYRAFLAWGSITLAWQIMNYMGDIHPHTVFSKLGYLLILQYSPLFMFGIFLHKAFSQGWKKEIGVMLITTALLFIIFFPESAAKGYDVNTCRILLTSIFLLCFFAAYFPENQFLSSKILVFFGKISYSWYLIHLALANFIFYTVLSKSIWIIYTPFISVLISFLVAIFFNRFIENPSHNLVMNFFRPGKNTTETLQPAS